MEATRLEKIKRQMADEYMATFPGITRQEAKRKVHKRAEMALVMRQVNVSVKVFTDQYRKAMREFIQAVNRSALSINTYVDHGRADRHR